MDSKLKSVLPDEYKTKDLGEAGAILIKGIRLLRLEQEQNFFWFVFEDKNTTQLSDSYWAGELLVEAKQYNDALRSLKDRLFARR